MKIAFAATEVVPYAKTGGLADVAGTLPRELEKLGEDVKVFMPKYYSINVNDSNLEYQAWISPMPIRIAGNVYDVHVYKSVLPGSNVEIFFIDCPHFFHRQTIYTDGPDEDQRFICFSKSVIETLQRLKWAPDVVHCNDWQTGLIPLYLRYNYNWDKMFHHTSTLFTIHNVGYQGKFDKQTLLNAEIDPDLFYHGGRIEHDGLVNFLKTGISFADVINTVSETYAKELLTPEYAHGMEKVLQYREKDLYGILNGVDYSIWNPATDKLIPSNYSVEDISGKEKNKSALLHKFNMSYKKDIPLIGIVSRFAVQKGFDLIFDAIDELMNLGAQWFILGSGEKEYEKLFRNLHRKQPDKVGLYIGYNETLAHQVESAADIFLMPSHYEPCGLNQIYSLKYGTVPVVRKTGGLADTVQDWDESADKGGDIGTGFTFTEYEVEPLVNALQRAIKNFHNKSVWRKIQKNGMLKDFSWAKSAKLYRDVYQKANEKR